MYRDHLVQSISDLCLDTKADATIQIIIYIVVLC